MNQDDSQPRSDRRLRRDLGAIVTDSIGAFVDYLHLRGVLVRLETREAGEELGKKAALLALAGLFAAIGYLGLVVAVIGWAIAAFGWSWPLATAIVSGLHVTVGVLAFLQSRRHPREPLFRDTLEELEKDRQWLSRKEKSKN